MRYGSCNIFGVFYSYFYIPAKLKFEKQIPMDKIESDGAAATGRRIENVLR
jgi:hypothetical protein